MRRNLFLSRKSAWRAAERLLARGIADRFRVVGRYERDADRSAVHGFIVLAWRGGLPVAV